MYERILIVLGPSPASRAAITEGIALAKSQGAEILFFSVLLRYVAPGVDMPPVGALSPSEFRREAAHIAQRRMGAATRLADRMGVPSERVVGEGADEVQGIIDTARKRRCALVIVASTGCNAVMRLLNGSVTPGLITRSPVPVLVVGQPSPEAELGRPASNRRPVPGVRPAASGRPPRRPPAA